MLNKYDTIYFTDSQDVMRFVHQRGIFKFVEADGFDMEIQDLNSDRQKILEFFIEELQVEIVKLGTDRDNLLEAIKRQIEANEELLAEGHKRIEESKTSLAEIDSHYSSFSLQVSSYINQLKSNYKTRAIKELYNEKRKIFLRTIEELKKPLQVRSLSQIQETSNFPIMKRQNTPDEGRYFINNNSSLSESEKSNGYALWIVTWFLALLWILTLLYFLWFNNDEIPQLYQKSQILKEQIDYRVLNMF